jgi:hypothetical protein
VVGKPGARSFDSWVSLHEQFATAFCEKYEPAMVAKASWKVGRGWKPCCFTEKVLTSVWMGDACRPGGGRPWRLLKDHVGMR